MTAGPRPRLVDDQAPLANFVVANAERDAAYQRGLAAGVELSAAACAARAERHAQVAERLLPDTAAREFIVLRGEAAACERAVRAVLAPAAAGGDVGPPSEAGVT